MEFVINTYNFLFSLIHSCAKLNWNVCISKHDFLELQILVAIKFATCRRNSTTMHNLVIMYSASSLDIPKLRISLT